MKKARRFLALALALLLCVSLFPMTAFAAQGDTVNVWVGGVQMKKGYFLASGETTLSTKIPSSGSYVFMKADGTALNMFNYDNKGKCLTDSAGTSYAIYVGENISLGLYGNNKLSGADVGIYSNCGIVIQGGDSDYERCLTIGASNRAMCFEGTTLIEDANVTANSIGSQGILCYGDLKIEDSNVTARGNTSGIGVTTGIEINNSTVTAQGGSMAINKKPVLNYSESYKITAGTDESNATQVTSYASQKWVRFEPTGVHAPIKFRCESGLTFVYDSRPEIKYVNVSIPGRGSPDKMEDSFDYGKLAGEALYYAVNYDYGADYYFDVKIDPETMRAYIPAGAYKLIATPYVEETDPLTGLPTGEIVALASEVARNTDKYWLDYYDLRLQGTYVTINKIGSDRFQFKWDKPLAPNNPSVRLQYIYQFVFTHNDRKYLIDLENNRILPYEANKNICGITMGTSVTADGIIKLLEAMNLPASTNINIEITPTLRFYSPSSYSYPQITNGTITGSISLSNMKSYSAIPCIGNTRWDGKIARWDKGNAVNSYEITVYLNGAALKTATCNTNSYDCSSLMSYGGTGFYTFVVREKYSNTYGNITGHSEAYFYSILGATIPVLRKGQTLEENPITSREDEYYSVSWKSVTKVDEATGNETEWSLNKKLVAGKYRALVEFQLDWKYYPTQVIEGFKYSLKNTEANINGKIINSCDSYDDSKMTAKYLIEFEVEAVNPVNLRWEGRTAAWDPVTGATQYRIIVFKGNTAVEMKDINTPYYDCSQIMKQQGGGVYAFAVFTLIDGQIMDNEIVKSPTLRFNPNEDITDIWVGGKQMAKGYYLANDASAITATKPASGGYAYLSEDGKTLTLNNYDNNAHWYVYYYGRAIFSKLDLTVKLEGKNTLTVNGDGIFAENSNLKIEGSSGSSLTINATKIGINCDKALNISNANITVTGDEAALNKAPILSGNYKITAGDSFSDAKAVSTYTGQKYARFEPVKANPFVDLYEGKVYYDAVLWAYYHQPKQITAGTDATHFSPDANCTRGQVVTFLWRAAGCPEADLTKLAAFKDADKISTPYKSAVAWAVEKGITNGYADGTFQPTKTVSRAEFVTFLWRSFGKPAPASTTNPFVDVSNNSVFKDAILWALGENITNGFDPTHFRPNTTCSRWQVVLFMFRAYD